MAAHYLVFKDPYGAETELMVESFYKRDRLSDGYVVEVFAYADAAIDIAIGQFMVFQFSGESGSHCYSGVVTHSALKYDYKYPEQPFRYQLVIQPQLAMAHMGREVVAYRNASNVAIIDDTLSRVYGGYGQGSYDLSRIQDPYKSACYDRIDISLSPNAYDYLQFQMNLGLFYYFEQQQGSNTLVMVSDLFGLRQKAADTLIYKAKQPMPKDPETYVLKSIDPLSFSDPIQSKTRHYDPAKPNQSLSQLMTDKGEVYSQSYFHILADQAELSQRLQIARQSLQDVIEVQGRFAYLDAGMRIDIDDISTVDESLSYSGEYFVYATEVYGQYNRADKRWSFESKAQLIPYTLHGRWYPPFYQHQPMPESISYAELQAAAQSDAQGRRAVKLGNSHLDKADSWPLYLREVQQTVTRSGGAAQSSRLGAEVVIALSNGQIHDPIILGQLANSKYESLLNIHNADNSGIQTDGGLSLTMKRRRHSSLLGNVQLQAINATAQKTQIEFGGIEAIDPQSQQPGIHRGIRLHSSHLAKFVTAHQVSKQVRDNDFYQYHFRQKAPASEMQAETDGQSLNEILETGYVDVYHYGYWTQALSEGKKTDPKPYVNRIQASHLLAPQLGLANAQARYPLVSTQLSWQVYPESAKAQMATVDIRAKGSAADIAAIKSHTDNASVGEALSARRFGLSPSQRSLEVTTIAGVDYEVVITHSYPVAANEQGEAQANYVDEIHFCFQSSLAFTQITLSDIQVMLDNNMQWQAQLSWQFNAEAELEQYQLSSPQMGNICWPKSDIALDELPGKTPFDITLKAQLCSGTDPQVAFGFQLADQAKRLKKKKAAQAGYTLSADRKSIHESHDLKTQYHFVSCAQQRILNPDEGHAHDFGQGALGLETYLSHTQVAFIQREDKTHYALDPHYHKLLDQAKGQAMTTTSQLTETHQGSSHIDHQGQVNIESQTKQYSKSYEACELIYSNEKGFQLSRQGKTFCYQGQQVTFNSPNAHRNIHTAIFQASKAFIINASTINIKAGSAEIDCEDYKTGMQLGITQGNTFVKCESADFGDDKPSMAQNSLSVGSGSTTALAAGQTEGGQQSKPQTQIKAGLQTLNIIPKWRKVVPDGDKLTSLAAINRLSAAMQALVLSTISQYYQADNAIDDQYLQVPEQLTPNSQWTSLVHLGFQAKIKAKQAQIKQKKAQIEQIQYQQAKLNLSSKAEVNQPQQNTLLADYQSQLQLLHKELDHIQQVDIQQAIDHIVSMMQMECLPAYAQNLGAGYLYVFLQDSKVEVSTDKGTEALYTQPHLFKEYAIISDADNYQFAEVDLSYQAGLDQRQANSHSQNYIELPAAYVKHDSQDANDDNNVKAIDKVIYFYSPVQLSWPRVHYYGGLAKTDPRLIESLSLPIQSSVLNALMAKASNRSALSKRGESPQPDNLKALWQQQCLNQYQVNQAIYVDHGLSQWQALTAYAVNPQTSSLPYVLLNDDTGVYVEQIQQVLYSQRQINDIINQLQASETTVSPSESAPGSEVEGDRALTQLQQTNSNDMKTAVLAWQTFFKPKSMGLVDIKGLPNNDFEQYSEIIQGIPKAYHQYWKTLQSRYKAITSGQQDLDKHKLAYALKAHARQCFKALMRFQQQQAYDYLSAKKADFELLWQDHFSVGTIDYISSHTQFWGMIQPLCIDPDSLDEALTPSVLPIDQITLKLKQQQTQSAINGIPSSAATYFDYEGYTHIQYQLKGYQVFKTTREYSKDCDPTTGQPLLSSQNTTVIKQLPEPIGYQFLDQQLLATGTPLQQMLFPENPQNSQGVLDFEQTLSQNEAYLKAQGQYNGVLLAQGQDLLAELIDDNQQLTDQNQAKSQAIAATQHFLDSLISTLQQRSHAPSQTQALSQLLPKVYAMVCDLYQQSRDSLTLSDSVPAKGSSLMQQVVIEGNRKRLQDLDKQQQQLQQIEKDNGSRDYIYRVGLGKETTRFGEVQKQLKYGTTQSAALLKHLAVNPPKKIAVLSEAYIQAKRKQQQAEPHKETTQNEKPTKDKAKTEKTAKKETAMIRRLKGFNGALCSAFGVFSAYQDFSNCIESLEEVKDSQGKVIDQTAAISNSLVSLGQALTQAVSSTNELAKNIAKRTHRTAAYKDFVKSLGLKSPSIQSMHRVLLGKFGKQSDKTLFKLLKDKSKGLTSLYQDIDVLTYLGVFSCSLSTLQATLQWIKVEGQNDPAVAASDFLNMISKGFYTAAAIKGISDKVTEKIKEQSTEDG